MSFNVNHRYTGLLCIAVFILFIINNLNAQDSHSGKPQIKVDVNKEVDENGNIIRYDSTYTYYYSNIDSAIDFSSFDSIFGQQFNNGFNFQFNSPFFNQFPNNNFNSLGGSKEFEEFFKGFDNNSFFNETEEILRQQMEILEKKMEEIEKMQEHFEECHPIQPEEPSQPSKKKIAPSDKDVEM